MTISKKKWELEQKWEADWHDNCVNSYWEETKQTVYAKRMGLEPKMVNGKFPVYNLQSKSVLDIGGGAYSLLLKCINGKMDVVDPCIYPHWVYKRYDSANIDVHHNTGEDYISLFIYDECWIYNCLQHTYNPQKVIKNALASCKILRIFEWIDNGVSNGHPQDLHEKELNEWLGGEGKVEQLNECGCVGKAYYGIFLGKHYEK